MNYRLLTLTLLACLGCPVDDPNYMGPATDTEASSDSSTSSPPMTTTTSGVDTTEGPASTTSGVDTGSTTDEGSTDASGSSSTGEPVVGGYGDCQNGTLACEFPAEGCLSTGAASVCGLQGCQDVSDCPVPESGTATVVCQDVSFEGNPECALDCMADPENSCPEGMTCVVLAPATQICMWPFMPPGGGECPDVDLGTEFPLTYMGNTDNLFDDAVGSCGGAGVDALLRWTAPRDDTYTFDTIGTAYDTVLFLHDGCPGTGSELACNDDG
ncbi:MAG: hypothetical protein E6R03_14945 [Hyphomicrobiaceae bacterium]|nr:MAG: hypothetical protein E6R03_14945 [Hyphomicrobiaceae bacterium]